MTLTEQLNSLQSSQTPQEGWTQVSADTFVLGRVLAESLIEPGWVVAACDGGELLFSFAGGESWVSCMSPGPGVPQ